MEGIMALIIFMMVFFSDVGFAADITSNTGAEITSLLKVTTSAVATDEAKEALRKKLEAQSASRASRVVVLQGGGSNLTFSDERMMSNIRTRIASSNAKFFPEVDLYQEGRKEIDPTVRPEDQRTSVGQDTIDGFYREADTTLSLSWNAISESQWEDRAFALRDMLNQMWFVDREELREPLFRLYAAIGYAAEQMPYRDDHFFRTVSDVSANYYNYLAAAMASQTPDLMSSLQSQEVIGNINYLIDEINTGGFGSVTISLAPATGRFNPVSFLDEYDTYINGVKIDVEHPDGLVEMPPGRNDIYLMHPGGEGHSVSVRKDQVETGQKDITAVRSDAHIRMGDDFIGMLMANPYECQPELDGDIMSYLSIYAKLHGEADVFIAYPDLGDVNKIFLWRWKRDTSSLVLVADDSGGFPVRFVATFGVGTTFNTVGVEITAPSVSTAGADTGGVAPELSPTGIPFDFQIRAHYGHLFGVYGAQASVAMDGEWEDAYETDGNAVADDATQTNALSTMVYAGIGYGLGAQAVAGLGPRIWLRGGKVSLPHLYDLTLHGGLSKALGEKGDGRVRPVIDTDFFAGAYIPTAQSVYEGAQLNFGMTVGAGFTF
jgi:hypothetical protein